MDHDSNLMTSIPFVNSKKRAFRLTKHETLFSTYGPVFVLVPIVGYYREPTVLGLFSPPSEGILFETGRRTEFHQLYWFA